MCEVVMYVIEVVVVVEIRLIVILSCIVFVVIFEVRV